jgi:general secretion pathway protein D
MLLRCPTLRVRWPAIITRAALLGLPFLFAPVLRTASAQSPNPADSPASVPAGSIPALPASPSKPQSKSDSNTISSKQAREADDAYLEGAKQVDHKDLAAAVKSFERAVHLSPNNRDYALALIVTRENYVTELVQGAAKARAHGDTLHADSMLAEAHTLDPNNLVVAQHFDHGVPVVPVAGKSPKNLGLFYSSVDPQIFPADEIASTLSGPVQLAPIQGKKNVHLSGDPLSVIRGLYRLYGITATFDSSESGGRPITMDLNNVTFEQASRVLDLVADTFSVPLQPKTVLVAKDTAEIRDALIPEVEETIYLPGRTNDEMQELANLARNIFDIKAVTASATGGYMLIRGNEDVLRQVNAVYDDMLDGNPEVLFDITLYELDKTANNNVGAILPSSAGIFSIAAEAQSLIASNQSIINQAIATGLLKLTGTPLQNLITEVGFLVASGAVSATQYTNLLGIFGGGLTFAGLYLGSNASFQLALNSTDVRLLDSLQIRSSDRQPGMFRAGTRYPVITATYSSGITSSLASSLSGLNINGTSVSSLLSQYLGGSTATVPQFQFEDLGITLKTTPHILHNDDVSLKLEMKIEALAGASINNIPILNNRALTSTITVPVGQTALLAAEVSRNEIKALTGLPGLSELPGFQGTEQDREKDSTELLITITPHIVRNGRMQISSRRLASVRTGPAIGSGSLAAQ